MKKAFFTSILSTALIILSAVSLKAQCSISGPGQMCTGQAVYTVSGFTGSIPAPTFSPQGSGDLVSVIGNVITINWNSNFFSGCSSPATFTISNGITSCSKTTTIVRRPNPNITGPGQTSPTTVIKPTQAYVNEYPATTYEVSSFCVDVSSIDWTVPNGWSIISGGDGSSTITVKPTLGPGTACQGNIKVRMQPSTPVGGCAEEDIQPVSLDVVAYATITNYDQVATTWPPLEICPDDDIIMDASLTSFCNAGNTNIYVELIESNASWQTVSTQGMWLTPSAYSVFGGLEHFDVRAFANSLNPVFNFLPNNFYKLKLAVGGTWNERTMHIEVKSTTNPAPSYNATNLISRSGGITDVRLIWDGVTTKSYEILYEISDSHLFPANGTTRGFLQCFSPTFFNTGLVSTDISSLESGKKFRYKVRECNCGMWSGWSSTFMLKPGKHTSINDIEESINLTVSPNPFRDNIDVSFKLGSTENVSMKLIDITGKTLIEVASQKYNEGDNKISIDTKSISSGIYSVVLTTSSGVYTRKLVCNK